MLVVLSIGCGGGPPPPAPPAIAWACGVQPGSAPGGQRFLGDLDPEPHALASSESTFRGFLSDRDRDGDPELLVSLTELGPPDTGLGGTVESTTEVFLIPGPAQGELDPAADAATTLFGAGSGRFGAVLADADLDADGACDLLLETPDGARLLPSVPAGRVDVGRIGFVALAHGDWWSPGDANADGVADLVGTSGEAAARVPGPVLGPVDPESGADLWIRDPDGTAGLDAVADVDGDGALDWLVETYRSTGYQIGSFLAPAGGELGFADADAVVIGAAQAAVLPDGDADGIAELLLLPALDPRAAFASAALPKGSSFIDEVTTWSLVDGSASEVGRITPADLDQDELGDLLVTGACDLAYCVHVVWGPLPTSGVHDVRDLAPTRIAAASALPVGDVDGDGWGDLVTTATVGASDWALVSGTALGGP